MSNTASVDKAAPKTSSQSKIMQNNPIVTLPETVESQYETITPARAKQFLEKNLENNRNVVKQVVDRYAFDMQQGHWYVELGDPIRFNLDGELIDGQHRLLAIIKSGVTLQMLVTRGLANDTIHAVDSGKGRRPADVLKIRGYKHTPLLGAALRRIAIIKQGPVTATRRYTATRSELVEMAEKHTDLQESCAKVKAIGGVQPSLVALIHYLGSCLLDKGVEADEFMTVFNTGIQTFEGDPAHLFREKLLRERSSPHRAVDNFYLMSFIHVWNHFAERTPVQQLKIPNQVTMKGLNIKRL